MDAGMLQALYGLGECTKPVLDTCCSAGRLMAVGVSLPDLWRTCSPLASVEGWDLSICNAAFGLAGGSAFMVC